MKSTRIHLGHTLILSLVLSLTASAKKDGCGWSMGRLLGKSYRAAARATLPYRGGLTKDLSHASYKIFLEAADRKLTDEEETTLRNEGVLKQFEQFKKSWFQGLHVANGLRHRAHIRPTSYWKRRKISKHAELFAKIGNNEELTEAEWKVLRDAGIVREASDFRLVERDKPVTAEEIRKQNRTNFAKSLLLGIRDTFGLRLLLQNHFRESEERRLAGRAASQTLAWGPPYGFAHRLNFLNPFGRGAFSKEERSIEGRNLLPELTRIYEESKLSWHHKWGMAAFQRGRQAWNHGIRAILLGVLGLGSIGMNSRPAYISFSDDEDEENAMRADDPPELVLYPDEFELATIRVGNDVYHYRFGPQGDSQSSWSHMDKMKLPEFRHQMRALGSPAHVRIPFERSSEQRLREVLESRVADQFWALPPNSASSEAAKALAEAGLPYMPFLDRTTMSQVAYYRGLRALGNKKIGEIKPFGKGSTPGVFETMEMTAYLGRGPFFYLGMAAWDQLAPQRKYNPDFLYGLHSDEQKSEIEKMFEKSSLDLADVDRLVELGFDPELRPRIIEHLSKNPELSSRELLPLYMELEEKMYALPPGKDYDLTAIKKAIIYETRQTLRKDGR